MFPYSIYKSCCAKLIDTKSNYKGQGMFFKDILSDMEKLIDKELCSINPKTPSIYLTSIDKNLGKYFVSNSPNSKGTARSFRELEDIWSELTIKGFSNVDQALYGGGSSRNQPETIFAHLPYIQHFKYKNRKHLLLRNEPVSEIGNLSELPTSELRIIRKKIDNYTSLSNQKISDSQISIFNTLKSSFDAIVKKYPGDVQIEVVASSLNKLMELNQEVINSIVTLDGSIAQRAGNDEDEVENQTGKSIGDLLDDETITGIENSSDSSDSSDSSEDGNRSVSTGRTKIRQLTPVVSLIYDRLSFGEIELQPDFQRKDRVWPRLRKSKLIESILMGLPLPVFYFAEKPDGDWIIVDGLQRITTIYDYMRGEFPLEGLEVLNEFNEKVFSELERAQQRKIREYPLTAHLIDMASDKDNIIVELFHRINTYGVKLSDQEIRSALNQGSSVKFLRFLAASPEFRLATQDKVKSDRQKDMELCLSAISFMLQGYKKFQNQYNSFLSKSMDLMNTYKLSLENSEAIDNGEAIIKPDSRAYLEIAKKFLTGLEIARAVFGEYAFKKTPEKARKIPISKPLFELIITYFSQLDLHQKAQVIQSGGDLIDILYEAIANDSTDFAEWESDIYKKEGRGFLYSISTSTGKSVTVRYRFAAFREMLKQSTGLDIELMPLYKEIN
ncbi:DUF262 domain-containing protein [Pseudoalteromonas carrageenovora]|uniref:DUF262 domain-containing protein n=1 Tax=Pseudoalteromonas carrageenovora TaxID=227 RepID=UPI0026E2EBD6|nr:DUF262 domain-containing protein [Pseudoalteromonas carrageenovora]MDO6634853.1 DUF262 domain-containing protein [Pseudoalteromonas carrageenovora]MDO6649576.1 DUF262 domain-containing protein [Pseudoalteromonas carrageenovora]